MANDPQVLGLLEEILSSGKTPEEVCRHCPELLPEVRRRWQQFQLVDARFRSLLPGLETSSDAGATTPRGSVSAPPAAIGRYQVRGTLGAGGFGAFYLGHGTQLDRPVAIKVLHAKASPAQAGEPALQEARRLAQLTTPFLLTIDGVQVTEREPWTDVRETWRVLRARFPGSIAKHSTLQDFFFGDDLLLRRHDYDVDVAGGFAGGSAGVRLRRSGRHPPAEQASRLYPRDGLPADARSSDGFH